MEYDDANEENLNNILSESNIKKKNYFQTEKILDDKTQQRRDLPLQIKVFKCIIYRNTDPSLDEEIVLDIIHKRNKSQGLDKNIIIKIPEENNFISKKENADIEEIKDKKEKKKKFRMSFLKVSKSSANI